ncbi:Cytochrome b-c1 complex subunit 8 [Eumeta japonica]|uniref:Cytochrome b-c1 complex subunit 8 n=1 Tax=Eumeta variegata TaxID=151549 RepID=A0A4C1X8L5_EUMVA|nr:Cytochrome b-c1 complex subunit 8 [Eumeta japonica]
MTYSPVFAHAARKYYIDYRTHRSDSSTSRDNIPMRFRAAVTNQPHPTLSVGHRPVPYSTRPPNRLRPGRRKEPTRDGFLRHLCRDDSSRRRRACHAPSALACAVRPHSEMGKHFGELAKIRGLVSYKLSQHEMRAFAGAINPGISNVIRRCRESFLRVVPPFVIAYLVYDSVEQEHHRLGRKNPADFENGKEYLEFELLFVLAHIDRKILAHARGSSWLLIHTESGNALRACGALRKINGILETMPKIAQII